MANKHGAIAMRVRDTGEVIYHAHATAASDYVTLCGQADDGDEFSDEPVETPPRARINCMHCRSVWVAARAFKASDFADKRGN